MEEKFICKFCGKQCKVNYELSYHQNRCKNNPNRIVNKPTYTNHHKGQCQYCGKEIDVAGLRRHEEACSNPDSVLNKTRDQVSDYNTDLTCRYCSKQYKDVGNLVQHEKFVCTLNPNITEEDRKNRKIKYQQSYNNKSDEAKQAMMWNRGLTKETDERVKFQGTKISQYFKDHPDKITGGYREGSAQRCKWGTYEGTYFDSSWELAFYIYCKDQGLTISRNKKSFTYIASDNEEHKFYPDFLIDSTFYEIKGSYSADDLLKIEQFPENLIVIDSLNINKYLSYVINRFGKNFTEILYDPDKPNYLNQPKKTNYRIINSEIVK